MKGGAADKQGATDQCFKKKETGQKNEDLKRQKEQGGAVTMMSKKLSNFDQAA